MVAGSVINVPDAACLIVSEMFTRTLTITWTSSRKWGLKNGLRREKGTIDGNEDALSTRHREYYCDQNIKFARPQGRSAEIAGEERSEPGSIRYDA